MESPPRTEIDPAMVMPKEVCCGNFRGLIPYVRRRYGDEGIQNILNGLVENHRFLIADKNDPTRISPIQEHHLTDPAYWVSYSFTLRLFSNVRTFVGGPDPLFQAGEGAVTEYFSKSMYFVVRIFGIKFLSKQVSKLNARLNRVKEVDLVELTERSATFRIRNFPGFPASKDICDWNRGIYTGLARLTDAVDPICEEIECRAQGGENCLFLLTWKKRERVIGRLYRWILRRIARDLVAAFEAAVTERDALIESLTRSEEKYRLLVENASDGIVVAQDGRIKFGNRRIQEIIGYRDDELKAVPFVNFVHPRDRDLVLERYRGRLAGERLPSTYLVTILNKEGQELKVQVNSVLIRWQGRPATLAFLRDVTQQQELEVQLRRAQKMESIGMLAGGVAHDLNNILSGIVSYPELLLLQLPPHSPLREPIRTIQKSGEKAAAVVQDLLSLARRGVIVTDIVNLNHIVSEFLKSPEHEALCRHHPQVRIETRLEPHTLNISGSSTHLSQTVMNLVSNAAEAMPAGGIVTITTGNRYIDRSKKGGDNLPEGDYAVLTVSDTGTGISPDDMEKIFEPFYTKKKMGRSGTGLGMAVVWGTVKDHKGHIDIESVEDQGTTFTLFFPAAHKELPEAEPSNLEAYRGHGESILVVDDVAEQRRISSGMLKTLGYSVVSAASGEEAVAYLKTHRVDLVVLDMIMDPGMDGLDTYQRMLGLHPGQKALIVSGFSETDRVKKVRELGAAAYLNKPFLIEKLGLAVKEALTVR